LLLFPSVLPGLAPDPVSINLDVADSTTGAVGAVASVVVGLVSLVCVMLGAVELRRSRLGAYRWLERSVLVSVLFGQVLLFWEQQLGAALELAFSLLLLAALRYAIRQEEARQALLIVQRSASATDGFRLFQGLSENAPSAS
jgi:hypothetical protein